MKKWYSLIDKVYNTNNLYEAFKAVKSNKGSPGVDGETVDDFEANLQPIFNLSFHPSSYGYRPGRSCQKAVAKAERFMNKYGLEYVVDMDLSKCFDTLDHELIIKAVNQKVSDGRVLRLIRSFLKSGIMDDVFFYETEEGSPQGGVISPLLANIYLDYFDKKMMAKNMIVQVILCK